MYLMVSLNLIKIVGARPILPICKGDRWSPESQCPTCPWLDYRIAVGQGNAVPIGLDGRLGGSFRWLTRISLYK